MSELWKEGNILFNDALNTFCLRLYGVRHMVKDHSDSERGNPLPPHGLLFPISSKGSFICIIPQTAQWVHPMKDRSDDPSHHERTLLPWSYISLPSELWVDVLLLSYIKLQFWFGI